MLQLPLHHHLFYFSGTYEHMYSGIRDVPFLHTDNRLDIALSGSQREYAILVYWKDY
jgi:hypothetical protein